MWRRPPGNSSSYLKSFRVEGARLGSKSFWARRILLAGTAWQQLLFYL